MSVDKLIDISIACTIIDFAFIMAFLIATN